MLAQLIQFLRSRKTQNILLSVFFVFLLSFGLARPAMASVLGDIGQGVLNALLSAVGLAIGVIFNILGMFTGALLGIAVLIFNWVSSPNFISLSYTNAGILPADVIHYNTFVAVGWELTRSLTNIIFVVAMVAIGIGTALRISGYQAQQALKNLVIIALLVNFTPVIAGLIIDASNITMGFFVNPEGTAAGSLIWQKSTSQWNNISQMVGGKTSWSPTTGGPEALAAGAASISLVSFNLVATVIYLLFAGLFVLRYIALWILVILSPFAFACYILPYTRSVWTQWWKMFIQWSILGVIAGFFLYLSEHIYSAFNSAVFTAMPDPSLAPGLATVMNGLLPSLIPIVLLFVGFVASIAGAPSAAQGIMKAGEKGMKNAIKWTGAKTLSKAQDKLKTGAAAERIGRWAARKPILGTMMGQSLLGYAEKRRGELEVGEKAMQSWRSENIAAQIGRMPELQKAGALKVLAERGHASQVKEEEQIKILMAAKAAGKEKDIIKFLPQYAEKIGFKDGIDGALRAQKPADIEKLDKSLFQNHPEVVKRIPHVYSPEKLGKLAYHGSEITNKVQEAFENEYKTNRDELIKNNTPGLRYLHSAMGSSLFKPVGNLEEIEGKAKSGGSGIVTPGSKEAEEIEKAIKERLKR